MESSYALAMRKLAKIREKNKRTQEIRLDEIRRTYPTFTHIEAAMRRQGSALAQRILSGTTDISDIQSVISDLQKQKTELLTQAGYPADYLDDIYTCPLCRDTGFDANGKRCSCLKQLASAFSSENSNLTEYMKGQTFDKADYSLFAKQPEENGKHPLTSIKKAYELGLRFAETFDETHANLLLMGNAGTGKTYLSSCIANYALARRKTVYYQTAFTLFDLLEKLKFGRLSGDEQENAEAVSRYIYDADLLILDDLGTEFISAYSTAALFDLVNTRQIRGKSTILSTNLSFQALEQLYSKRFLSRVVGNFEIIPFIGQDLRMQKYNNKV